MTSKPYLEAEFLDSLPLAVRKALESSDVSKGLRSLAEKHKLSLDKWSILEDEVQMALAGVTNVSDLYENMIKEVGVDSEIATELFNDVVEKILRPIREEMERELDHPEAQVEGVSEVEAFAQSVQSGTRESDEAKGGTGALDTPAAAIAPSAPGVVSFSPEELHAAQVGATIAAPTVVQPTTPAIPQTPTQNPIVNVPKVGEHYKPGQASATRKQIDGDPYREPVE